jgi:hypothetical protein
MRDMWHIDSHAATFSGRVTLLWEVRCGRVLFMVADVFS